MSRSDYERIALRGLLYCFAVVTGLSAGGYIFSYHYSEQIGPLLNGLAGYLAASICFTIAFAGLVISAPRS